MVRRSRAVKSLSQASIALPPRCVRSQPDGIAGNFVDWPAILAGFRALTIGATIAPAMSDQQQASHQMTCARVELVE
jgi:hypothetical protein